jgi:uncharacterized repeat protein (TIGR02543 family)
VETEQAPAPEPVAQAAVEETPAAASEETAVQTPAEETGTAPSAEQGTSESAAAGSGSEETKETGTKDDAPADTADLNQTASAVNTTETASDGIETEEADAALTEEETAEDATTESSEESVEETTEEEEEIGTVSELKAASGNLEALVRFADGAGIPENASLVIYGAGADTGKVQDALWSGSMDSIERSSITTDLSEYVSFAVKDADGNDITPDSDCSIEISFGSEANLSDPGENRIRKYGSLVVSSDGNVSVTGTDLSTGNGHTYATFTGTLSGNTFGFAVTTADRKVNYLESLSGKTSDGAVEAALSFGKDAKVPEGSSLTVETASVNESSVLDKFWGDEEGVNRDTAKADDIRFVKFAIRDRNGNEVRPETRVSVKLTFHHEADLSEAAEGFVKKHNALAEGPDGTIALGGGALSAGNGITTVSFADVSAKSAFGYAVTTAEKKIVYATKLTGKSEDGSIEASLRLTEEAKIPEGSLLKVTPVTGESVRKTLLDNIWTDTSIIDPDTIKLTDSGLATVTITDKDGKVRKPEADAVLTLTFNKKADLAEAARKMVKRAKAVEMTEENVKLSDSGLSVAEGKTRISYTGIVDGQTFGYAVSTAKQKTNFLEGKLSYEGEDYTIEVNVSKDNQIPENSKLNVKELDKDSEEFKKKLDQATEAIQKDAEKKSSDDIETSVDDASVRMFDITILNEDGDEIQPNGNVRVSVQYKNAVKVGADAKMKAVHFDEKNDEVQVLTPETKADTSDTEKKVHEVKFDANGFSVYAIVSTVLRQTLTASDGNEYLVTVTYDNTSGIPSDAELYVSEIKEGETGYEDYVAQSAAALGEKPENLAFARPFDITLKNPQTGEEYQPNKNVAVTIELLKDDLNSYASVDVIHIPDEAGREAEVMDTTVHGESVEFETSGFSVYVLTGVFTYTYEFYTPTGDVPETVTETGFTVENWSSYYSQISVQTETGTAYSQTVKNGETPVIPQIADTSSAAFAGWFEGDLSGTSVSFGKNSFDFDNVEITENRTIRLFARFSTFAEVIFHDQYNSSLADYPVMYTRRGELVNGSANIKISDVSATYSGSEEYVFYGWSETPVQNPGDTADLVSPVVDGCISVTGPKHLYPVFRSFHWLSFYSAYTSSGATYVPQVAYFDGDGPTALTVPVWEGHTFLGWFNGDLTTTDNGDGTTTDTVTYSTQITNADGSLIAGVEGTGVKVYGGKLTLSADTTLYAKWSDAATVNYTIIIWKQKTTDADGLENSAKCYDFVESIVKAASIGATVSVDSEYIERTYTGFSYNRCDGEVTVNPSGYTVLNVYYDKDAGSVTGASHTLTFRDSVTGTGACAGLPVTYEDEGAVAYETPILTGNNGRSFVPADPTPGRKGFSFSGWYADENCSTRVFFDKSSYNAYRYSKVLYETMPNEDLTIYAGWSADWYIVQIDPNYGTFNGSGGTWFWETIDGDLIREYTQVTRDYVPSSSGTFYYAKHDRAYYGYSGNEWDNSEPDRNAFYTEDPSEATEDTTFEYAPGVYTYAGWYEVHADGTETLYDFSQHVDHDTILRLHWKKSGTFYVAYEAGTGSLSGTQDSAAYADQAGVLINCSATAPSGYVFEGWQVRGDASGRIYRVGQNFILNAEYAVTVGGKSVVYLDAVYTKAGTAKIVYDPNGGTISGTVDTVDFGMPCDNNAPTPVKSISDGKATISNLVNNSVFTLSDGKLLDDSAFAFQRTDAQGNSMTLAGWSTEKNYQPGDPFYDLGGEYGVDAEEPITLYAVWQVTVTYHLNTESESANWGGDWTESGYIYDDSQKTYAQKVFLNNAVSEPSYTPEDTENSAFLYWMSEATGVTAYSFSTKVAGKLDLYAKWGSTVVKVHAVDASAADLAEKAITDGWDVHDIVVGATPVAVTGTSHVTPPAPTDPADPNYLYAFSAVSADRESVSEDNAITNVFYNTSDKKIYVTYASGTTGPLGDNEVYFVYYLEKSLNIGYKSMVDVGESSGALADVTLAEGNTAPTTTGYLGTYNMTDKITQPKGWVSDSTLGYYSFAVGTASAGNAGDLHVITTALDSDSNRPGLQIRNTWQGFQYSTDGNTWVSCGYDPALYVVYYKLQPTIVMIEEQTVGNSTAMEEQFQYQVIVQQRVTDNSDPDNPSVTETNVFTGTYTLPDSEGKNAQSAILFYSNSGGKETAQKITVTQTAKEGFTTSIDAAGKGTVVEAERKWTYTTGATVEAPTAIFTNTQSNLPVEVHVARIDISTNVIVPDDTMRSGNYSFGMNPGESKTFLTELPAATVFGGDSTVYAFGAVLYGTDDGSIVTPASMEVASVAFSQVNGNHYELMLKDNSGNDLAVLAGYKVYYLYYPMPQIRYVKESANGALTEIKGSLDGTSNTNTITYGRSTVNMNGAQVSQGQRFSFPTNGFRITQEVGTNTFRMPPILDDGIYARYLSYSKLGAGNAADISSIGELGEINVSSGLTMYLRVQNNVLQWSFTEEAKSWNDFSGSPTVYAIYEERGYDLQITKAVPIDVGNNPSFTITLSSAEITKNSYRIEGYTDDTIVATPASGSTPGTITLTVSDGTSVKLKGLGQGPYTVKETNNNNYNLTAKCGPLNGALTDVTVTNSSLDFSLDRERKLELTNTSKAICKITVNGTEIPFYTLQSAVEYVVDNISSKTATIQMLTDYLMPSVDKPVIPAGYTITLNTADTSGGIYNFDGGSLGTASGATITRATDNTNGSLVTSRGTLTFANVTLNGNNVETDSAMIISSGTLNIGDGALLEKAKNTNGNGGAISATEGTVSVASTIRNCSAGNGGAIYSEGSAITITGTLSGNNAINGGAIYYDGTGTISISGSAGLVNNKSSGNGGAIYATAGTIAVSGGSMTKNTASGNGGAIYTVDGAVNVSGGTIGGTGNANSAINGSAAFIQSGSASFSGGSITANTATSGGAIGVGGTSARLYFSGAASITGNTMAGSASNVYLNQDTDAIINAEGLEAGAEIGIYVSGDMSADLFKNRGVPGAKFGVYSSETGITAFKNDRLAGITVTADTAARRLVWGKSIQVRVRYLENFASFPQKSGGSWNGTQKPQNGWERSYYLPSNNNSASSIGDDLRSKYDLKLTKTAAFACAFVDDGTNDIAFENYVTEVNWDSSANSWKFTKRDGTVVSGEKLVVYYSEPAYINIENNTSFPLNITELSLRERTAAAGYGYVFAVNGAVQDKLMPITAADLTLGAGKSLKLMFPGGVKSQVYTLKGGFVVGGSDENIPVRQTGVSPSTTLSGPSRTDFTLNSGKTGNANGSTVDVVFGGSKPICKIVTTTVIDGVQDSEIAGIDNPDEDGVAYLFSSLQQAVTFAQSHSLTGAVIELLVDYLIPGADAVSIPANYNLTFTTAIGDTGNDYNYSNDSSARATISRDNSNTDSFIVVADGQNSTKLTVTNLIFDGKNYSGDIAGGVIKTTDCEVEITNCDFKNCIAKDGGGIKIEYNPSSSNYTNAKLTVTGCNFTNCKSDGSFRQGGGAIWTNACSFTLTGEKDTNGNYTSGVFDSCVANDQGGAVFHRIDWAYPEEYRLHSTTTVQNCKFINCQAKAAGGLEIDSYSITTSDCWFENCQATTRNAGGFNVFIQYKVNGADEMNPPVSATGPTKLNVTNCTFKYCTANQHGGGFRTLSHETTLTDCIFIGNTAGSNHYGGGISITNQNATEGVIKGCTVQNCSARSGGGVFFDGSKNADAKLTIMDDPDHNCESIISGNTASNQGGGVYTGSATTLINTQIQNNTLTTGMVNNAAGMYVNSKTLTIGKTGAEVDTTVITNNTVSGGGASNLHLWGGDKAGSIVVNCDLSEGSHIGVTNPGSVTQQFGTSPNSTTSPFWRPYGLADPTPDDPDYYPTFVADDGSVYGIIDRIDRSDQSGKKIIWGGPPVCKITDADGNLLYLDNAKKYPAIFDALEGGTAGSWASAFSVLGVANPTLYTASKNPYTTKTYKVQMLIGEYQLGNTVTTFKVPNDGTPLDITLTTANESDGSYPYRGTPGSVATIVRKSGFNNPMFSVGTKTTFTGIVLDGGSTLERSSTANGAVLHIKGGSTSNANDGSRYAFAVLGEGAVIRNSATSGNGTVYVDWGDFTLAGGTIENCTAKNGGAIYMKSRTQTNPARGYLRLESGSIVNCSASNGGGVYVNTGTFSMTAVSIRNCTATTNGGGICYMADGQSPQTKEFTMSGGIISNCSAANGGGVYVNNNKAFAMSGGFIMGNTATTKGGGIAIGGTGVVLTFSRTPWVSGNTCSRADMDSEGNACNLELDSYADTVIQTDGIWNGAKIGVYVPGNRDDNTPGNDTDPYKNHGGEGDRFGTFNNLADASYLYGFVNDRNGLKGGLQSGSDPQTHKGIHWIKIFSLEISNEVISYQNDDNEGFRFKVTLTGTASDGTVAEAISSTAEEPEKYGGLYFVNGVATQMVVKEDETTRVVDLILKSGESVTGERLPAGLNYTVEEILTEDQKKAFAALPDETIRGYIGEYAESTTRNRYLSTAEFTNLRPVCKVEGDSENILYYKTAVKYNWNDNGSFVVEGYDHYQPAVYATLEEAFEVINNGAPRLYFKGNDRYYEFTGNSYHIAMLAPYTLQNAETVNSGKTITIKTAGVFDPVFPYQGSGNTTISRGGFASDSMFTAEGELILRNIILDGRKTAYTATANGGIVNVPDGGKLTVESGAILRNSLTTGNGGAVYAAAGGTVNVTGGIINMNAVNGTGVGAGIYLVEGASLKLKGDPFFGGTGVYNDGSINLTTGNIQSGKDRQDIFISGYASTNDEDTSANSLDITGNITSGNGTIWVWANESPHYKTLCQFAKYTSAVTDTATTLAAFRNAQDDAITGADQVGEYLYGITKSDDTGRNVYWYGVEGSAHVTLVKVLQSGTSYKNLKNKTFTVYTDSEKTKPAKGTVYNNDGTVNDKFELSGLSSSTGGAFFIGEMAYGTYYVVEDGVAGTFVITIDNGGVVRITDNATDPVPVKSVRLTP